MAHRCGWRNKPGGKYKRCHNLVDGAEGRWYCAQVPHSRWWNEMIKRFFHGSPPGYENTQRADKDQFTFSGLPPRDRVTLAVQIASEITSDPRWQRKALQRASVAMGENLYEQSRDRPAAELCAELNEIAVELLRGSERAKMLVAAISEEIVFRLFPRHPLSALIARRFATYIAKPLDTKVVATARALRAYGVLICAVSGDLDTCPCLYAVAKSDIKKNIASEVREVVGRGLENLRV